jgi:membrane protease YdiL (CAAX protease family)
MIAVTQFLFPLAVLWVPVIAPSTAILYGAFGAATPFKLAVMIAVIVGEEIVWRGLVQSALGQRFGVRAAVVLAGLAYAVGHAPVGSPLLVLVALCCGLYWGALRAITKSLVPSLVSHILWDLTVLVWVPVLHQ